jgi:hypothetical protein
MAGSLNTVIHFELHERQVSAPCKEMSSSSEVVCLKDLFFTKDNSCIIRKYVHFTKIFYGLYDITISINKDMILHHHLNLNPIFLKVCQSTC